MMTEFQCLLVQYVNQIKKGKHSPHLTMTPEDLKLKLPYIQLPLEVECMER